MRHAGLPPTRRILIPDERRRALGFVDCGIEETEFGGAPRMVLAIS